MLCSGKEGGFLLVDVMSILKMDSTLPFLAFAPGQTEGSAETKKAVALDEKGDVEATKIAVEEVQEQ